MSRRDRALTVVMLLSGLFVWGAVGVRGAPEDADATALVTGNNTFALDLYGALRKQEGNLFLSPFSISTALAMTYAGARGNTAAQMEQALHFEVKREHLHQAFAQLIEQLGAQAREGGYQLSVANALWGQQGAGFLEEFLNLTEKHYGAGLRQVDFAGAAEAARRTINAWVEKETQGKIKDLLQPGVLGALTRLVLTNAIYFKGTWASQFEEGATREEPFTLATGQQVKVPMMNKTEKFGYTEAEDFQALELPYAGDDLSMVVFLPRTVDGLPALEEKLSLENLERWLGGLRRRQVQVSLPRFTMTSQFGLQEVLKSLGITDAFSLPPADFSGMNGRTDLFISAVVHKAFVDVNEEGTEAAAATAVVAVTSAARPEPVPVFRADHPFIFLIRDTRSGSVLFMGRFMNPKA